MWTCEKCSARNWDENSACHRCRAPISPELAAEVKTRRLPPVEKTRSIPEQPLILPRRIELLDGALFTDGGSVSLKVRDETGAEYGIALSVLHGRRGGGWGLFFRNSQVVLASQQHLEILQLLKDASIRPAPEAADGPPTGEVVPRKLTIIDDDLKVLFGSMGKRESFLSALRGNLVNKLEALSRSPTLDPDHFARPTPSIESGAERLHSA